MTQHDHHDFVEGCYRCDLSRDEVSEYTPTTEEVIDCWILFFTRNHDAYMTGVSMEAKRDQIRSEITRWLAAHDAEVLREAANALDETIQGLNHLNPLELAYINCTHIDAQEVRHRAARIERGER